MRKVVMYKRLYNQVRRRIDLNFVFVVFEKQLLRIRTYMNVFRHQSVTLKKAIETLLQSAWPESPRERQKLSTKKV